MMRNLRLKDDGWSAMLSGLLTGFACLFETPSRVSELMLYCVPKALDICWNFGGKYWGWKPVDKFEVVLFVLGNAALVSALQTDLKSTYFNALRFGVTGKLPSATEKKSRETTD